MRKLTIEEVRQKGLEKGFYLNSKEYVNNKEYLSWSCKAEWHEFPMRFNNIYNQNQGCPYCAGLVKHTVEYVRQQGLEKGFYLNSEVYENCMANLSWSCKVEWHEFKASYNSIDRDQGCYQCYTQHRGDDIRLEIEEVRSRGFEKGFYLNSEEYVNNKELLSWSCKTQWHEFSANLTNIYHESITCPKCPRSYIKWEKDVYEILVRTFPQLKRNQRRLLKTKRFELDVWDPVLRKAIECDGPWHYESMGYSQENLDKRIDRDLRKNKECENAGIKLLRIRYSEYVKDPQRAIDKMVEFMREP
jgi:hypothetical protein